MKTALQDALDERGYETLTPVQTAVLNPDLTGRDLLVSAQTGSGKTLGFGLAIAPTILQDAEKFEAAAAPMALVIAPTRELALQVKRELAWLYAKAGAVMASCVGGMDMRDERRALARGAHIVVATPGRLRDHISRGSIDLSVLRAVVLDEADEMLDLGFREDLEFILGEAPDDRQTLLFSATVPNAILGLAKSYQRDAERVIAKSENGQHADIEYRAMTVADRDVDNAVINTLRFYEAPNAIVFANTRAMVNRLTTRLSNRGFNVVALSGELSQSERTHALQAMRDGRAQVCVATDVAARGIDLPNLDLVVHAELPNNHETLLHRSGRTGRAGRKGVSALIINRKSNKKASRILGMAKLQAEWGGAPTADEVKKRDQERLFADPAWLEPVPESDQETVASIMDAFTPEQIAAGFLRLMSTMRTAPEELSDVDTKPAPREDFGVSVWFSVSGGRATGAEPRRILPMLCDVGGINKNDIGAIRVQENESFVQIKEGSVAGFLAKVGPEGKLERGATLTQLAEAPKLERMKSGGGPRGGSKFGGKGKPSYDKPKSDKPWGDKPKSDRPYSERPKFDKPKSDKPKFDKPKFDKPKGKPAAKSNAPIDWNDDPTPRAKKPKPASKGGKPAAAKSKPYRSSDGPKGKGGDTAPRRRPGAHQEARPTEDRKGPPPPAGKSNSKKNKARAAAAKAAKGKGSRS
ncbi:ATP-dependent RNA helicase DeaD [Shimia sp. SK013]|uniref:DEAD/DEAH box helicase n=1 Tax=Shimia sp. SK013 TaxID=1389006 RepID=UPI0006B66B53|nr:DEAD/DEAH box helicase [Shimia sp. SK013]KPA20426.1 ATP-dependent RNA helicase DeaD [Shimia sp. SK013]